ncbi:hypothetical protein A0U40_09240 [[Bacillus] sp. KCTC 13219]|nr:hypothetical protein A0U40_09240 [[Bacillus] sp. KCTC 13219]
MMRNIIATVQNVGYARLFGQPLSSTSRFFICAFVVSIPIILNGKQKLMLIRLFKNDVAFIISLSTNKVIIRNDDNAFFRQK